MRSSRPSKLHHQARQIVDLDRLAHVEHEHLAAGRHGAGLDDQFGGFRDRHEVADDLGVRDGHRTAGCDLLAEAADDGAGAVEHVAEADHREDGADVRLGGVRLQDQLAEALACPHDVGRPHCLVGRDEHAALDAQVARDMRAMAALPKVLLCKPTTALCSTIGTCL